jgi:hypothetical protein
VTYPTYSAEQAPEYSLPAPGGDGLFRPASAFDPQDTEAVLGVVERDAVDQAAKTWMGALDLVGDTITLK